MALTLYLAYEEETQNLGARLAKSITDGAVIFLEGHLGAGKTTLVRGFLQALGYKGKVKSPTYTLVEPYELATRPVYHFDFYRLKHPEELEHIGLQEYFFEAAICLVEWPEKGFPFLPEPDLICQLCMHGTGRKATLKALTQVGANILQRLNKAD